MRAKTASFLFALMALCGTASAAALVVPHVFGDHMVLQADQPAPVWGWDKPGGAVAVRFAGQEKQATAADDGRWEVRLNPVNKFGGAARADGRRVGDADVQGRARG